MTADDFTARLQDTIATLADDLDGLTTLYEESERALAECQKHRENLTAMVEQAEQALRNDHRTFEAMRVFADLNHGVAKPDSRWEVVTRRVAKHSQEAIDRIDAALAGDGGFEGAEADTPADLPVPPNGDKRFDEMDGG